MTKVGRKPKPKGEWLADSYAKEWLSKVADRTKHNYEERFPKWLAFINMSPTEQIQKRIADLQSSNPKVRGFFEDKTVEYKNMLVAQNLKPSSVQSYLTSVLSFFSAHRLKLSFKRGELKVTTRTEDKVLVEWIPSNEQARQIYQQGDARDRALFLVLYQSGFSETDVSSLNIEQLPNIYSHEGHFPISLYREKTDVLQRTCISEEAVHDIKAMLRERGQPQTGALFISQKGKRLDTRFINDCMKVMVTKAFGEEEANKFKTKSLRDCYNDALLRANLTQEVKDTLFGHKRSGAKEKYAISQATVLEAYAKAFQYLSVNHGTQARKDIEKMNVALDVLTDRLAKLEKSLLDIAKIVSEGKAKLDSQDEINEQVLRQIASQKQQILDLIKDVRLGKKTEA